MKSKKFVAPASWRDLNEFTAARIALGRAGNSLPTDEVLKFGLAHAQARDAVHAPLDTERLIAQLRAEGFNTTQVASRAEGRRVYLQRPDLGRQLSEADTGRLKRRAGSHAIGVAIIDGLSSLAVQQNAVPLLRELRAQLSWNLELSPVVVATQGRVALGDAIAETLKLELVIVLIGERPGLSSPDSLGAYVTYAPRVGSNDAQRNCVSNIRPQGLNYAAAAHKIKWLCENAMINRITGVTLKDDSDSVPLSRQLH
jgi:ethanolamine ammonia-lyase small subunit